MSYTATYFQHDGIRNLAFPSHDNEESALKAFEHKMEEINPDWANLICTKTGKQIGRYEKQDIVGVFEGKARTIKEPDGIYVAVWTDGVTFQQKGKKAKLSSDNEPLAAFRLKKGVRYRVTVTEIKED